MPRTFNFHHAERKVHMFHDQFGATYGAAIPGGQPRKYADTLCKGNWEGPDVRSTSDPALVTCKICRKDHRFIAKQAAEAPSPVEKPKEGRRTRYRVSFWGRKLILQVEVNEIYAEPQPPHDSHTYTRWRDARLEDLGKGIV